MDSVVAKSFMMIAYEYMGGTVGVRRWEVFNEQWGELSSYLYV